VQVYAQGVTFADRLPSHTHNLSRPRSYPTFFLSASRAQVGSVQVYAQDASFAAFRWKSGDICGTKEAAMHGAILMCLTSSITPTLMPDPASTFEQHDWAYLYPAGSPVEGEKLRELNRRFQVSQAEGQTIGTSFLPHQPLWVAALALPPSVVASSFR
jgi:hypothetical protein